MRQAHLHKLLDGNDTKFPRTLGVDTSAFWPCHLQGGTFGMWCISAYGDYRAACGLMTCFMDIVGIKYDHVILDLVIFCYLLFSPHGPGYKLWAVS